MQLVDWQVMPASFTSNKLNRQPVRELTDMIECVRSERVRRQSQNEDYSEFPGVWGGRGQVCGNAARCAARLDDIEIKEKYLDSRQA